MTTDELTTTDRIDTTKVRPVVRVGLAIVVLAGLASRYVRAMGPVTGFLAQRVAGGDRTGHVEGDEQV